MPNGDHDGSMPRRVLQESDPAFPVPDKQFFGMSLRDYFAAQALQGLVQAMRWPAPSPAWPATLTEQAFIIADAMLAERAKKS